MRCTAPINIKTDKPKDWNNAYQTLPVPCGKCRPCRLRRIAGWSFRLKQESRVSTSAHFVTLTYDADNIPITMNGYGDLSKHDVQKYFKRLRRLQEVRDLKTTFKDLEQKTRKIKYYLASEYGEKSYRPHYHIILFNADKDLIEKAWKLGNVHIGKAEPAAINYTMKYIQKPSSIPMHELDDRNKEFTLMSKGIGSNYLTRAKIKYHRSNILKRCYLRDGDLKIPMPRYYKEKIYTKRELQKIGLHLTLDQENEVDPMQEINIYNSQLRKQNKEKRVNSTI